MGICCCTICGAMCFNAAQTKTLEIALIILNSISFVLIILCLGIIKFNEMPKANLALFIIMLLINLAYLIFSIILRYWRAKNVIKEDKRSLGVSLSQAGLILGIVQFIFCLIEEIVFIIGCYRTNHPCYRNDEYYNGNYHYYRRISSVDCFNKDSSYYIDVITWGQEFIAYITFSYLEIAIIFAIILFHLLKNRIQMKLDGPPQVHISPQVVDPYGAPYGRDVIVVQPGDVVMMGGNQYQYNPYPYAQNQQNNMPAPNMQYPGGNPYPGSNDFQMQEKIS